MQLGSPLAYVAPCYFVWTRILTRCSSMIYHTSRPVPTTLISLQSSIHTESCTGSNILAMCHHPLIPFHLFLHLSLQYIVSTITRTLTDLLMLVPNQSENLAPVLDHPRAHIGSMHIQHIWGAATLDRETAPSLSMAMTPSLQLAPSIRLSRSRHATA